MFYPFSTKQKGFRIEIQGSPPKQSVIGRTVNPTGWLRRRNAISRIDPRIRGAQTSAACPCTQLLDRFGSGHGDGDNIASGLRERHIKERSHAGSLPGHSPCRAYSRHRYLAHCAEQELSLGLLRRIAYSEAAHSMISLDPHGRRRCHEDRNNPCPWFIRLTRGH